MTKERPHMSRSRLAVYLLAGAALCAVVPVVAQVAPPSRGERERERPNYVDSADYDRQPYYVDGVEYKPYVPEKKPSRPSAKPAAETVKAPSQSSPGSQQDPSYVSPAPQSELRPFVPSQTNGSSSSAAPRQQAQSSASASATPSYARAKRPRYGVAIIEALDKISSESVRFEAPIGQPVRYKGLIYTVKACETAAEDEPMADVIAYMQVRTNPVTAANNQQTTRSKEIFRGWTYASTPSLNPLEHPIYDAWVIACRKPLVPPVAVAAPAPPAATPAPKS
jgi:hypothetical protein